MTAVMANQAFSITNTSESDCKCRRKGSIVGVSSLRSSKVFSHIANSNDIAA